MIAFFYETDFQISNEEKWKDWLDHSVRKQGFETEEINYIFCDDEYLLQINIEYLAHDYYTDVIGFQYSEGKNLVGDIYISIDRVKENAIENRVEFHNELARVMIHGILHFMNFRDETEEEEEEMRKNEDKYLSFFEEIN
ncbi:MAG: rRNA maturation RNase YbeY [Flavobacteriaceae bacterium]|jgi:rRNA maturation RNase YbeY|nr:rRNA maturation RNase YbeY [Flavobacteriaceae bacterium]